MRAWVVTFLMSSACGTSSGAVSEVADQHCEGGRDSGVPSSQEVFAHSLFELMRLTHVSEPLLTFSESLEASEHVLLGTIESVVPGRVARHIDGGPVVRSVLFILKVEEALKGGIPAQPNFEHISGAIPAETYAAEVPHRYRIIVLLAPSDGWDLDQVELEHSSPEVVPVLRLTQQYGLMVEASDGIATPIWVEPNDVGVPEVANFDELRSVIRDQTRELGE